MNINLHKLVAVLTVAGVMEESNTKRYYNHLSSNVPKGNNGRVSVKHSDWYNPDATPPSEISYETTEALSCWGVDRVDVFKVLTPPEERMRDFTQVYVPRVESFDIDSFMDTFRQEIGISIWNEYQLENPQIFVREKSEYFTDDADERRESISDYGYVAELAIKFGHRLYEVTRLEETLIFKFIPDIE